MKSVKLAVLGLLAACMTLGIGVTPADAGDKGSKKRVHINSGVSSKNLRAVSKKLKGHQKQAVKDEIERRERIHQQNKLARDVGNLIGDREDIEGHIIGLGILGSELVKRSRGSGH